MKPIPSLELVRKLLSYDPETGDIVWLKSRKGHACKGKIAGCIHNGYRNIKIAGAIIGAHRIAWSLHYGDWPKGWIDHKNGVRSDNRIENLRDATPAVNCQNRRRAHVGSASGYLGAHWNKYTQKYQAQIEKDGKSYYLGAFADPADAHAVYLEAKRKMHEGCTI